MKKITKFFDQIKYKTLIKYFFSYFFIISALLFCFFIAFRQQMQKTYYAAQDKNIQEKLLILQKNINDGLNTVFQIHDNLVNNYNLSMFRKFHSPWYEYLAINDMREFASSNSYISDIIYIDNSNNEILACNYYVTCVDNTYILKKGNTSLIIPVQKYGHQSFNSIVYVENENSSELLCFPPVANKNYELFYILKKDEMIDQLNAIPSEEIVAVCLTDSEKHVIDGISEDKLMPYLGEDILSSKLQKIQDGKNTIYTLPFYSNLYLVVLLSQNVILDYMNETFLDMYLAIALIGSIGILLIAFAMKMTYIPLYRLTDKYVKEKVGKEYFEKQLDTALMDREKQEQELQEKLEKYHVMMQESILDSLVRDKNMVVNPGDLDKLFNMEQDSIIFVATVSINGERCRLETGDFRQYIDSSLSPYATCILLEKNERYESWLIYYYGQEQDKESVIHSLMKEINKTYDCNISLSNSSCSPLDISSLYENSIAVSEYWSRYPVAIYGEVMQNKKGLDSYPYKKLDDFAVLLQNRDLVSGKQMIMELFDFLDESVFPSFYTRSLVIDMITVTVMTMNRLNIKFKAYGDTYFEALYYARSFPYEQKSQHIQKSILRLIDIFQEEVTNGSIYPDQLQKIVNEKYTSSDFSISVLADEFHVSIAYISYLFKKYYNQTFSEYLWELRVKKAQELLRDTEEPIENISIAVGYENVSSFRRKFKKELSITPSQYREAARKVKI